MWCYGLVFLAHGHSSTLLDELRQVVDLRLESLNRLLSFVLLRVRLVDHPPGFLDLLRSQFTNTLSHSSVTFVHGLEAKFCGGQILWPWPCQHNLGQKLEAKFLADSPIVDDDVQIKNHLLLPSSQYFKIHFHYLHTVGIHSKHRCSLLHLLSSIQPLHCGMALALALSPRVLLTSFIITATSQQFALLYSRITRTGSMAVFAAIPTLARCLLDSQSIREIFRKQKFYRLTAISDAQSTMSGSTNR